ncbi:YdcF family protein [Dissulfurirhabdus thermomarina]|nr:YdcF family protein [Dissulfurirhabdus thermomarina]
MAGFDGLSMLALSTLVILATGGLSFLAALAAVVRTAATAPADVAGGSLFLVLGQRLRNGRVTPDYARRLRRAAVLLARRPGARALVLGGRLPGAAISEASAGARFLEALGVAPGRILREDGSRHTLENLQAARGLLAGAGPGEAVLVTNRYHLARSLALASGLGLELAPCAAEDRFRHRPGTWLQCLKEAYYLHWYRVGRAWSLRTGNRRMIRRIS